MKLFGTLIGTFLMAFSGAVVSQESSFSAAAKNWLDGDEIASIKTLSAEANAGNTDAQLLLGQIDRDTVPGGFSDFLEQLSKKQRRVLLRAPGEDASINWLLALSDPALEKLGSGIFGYKLGREPIANALVLQSTGEFAAADFVLWSTINDGRFDLVNSMPSENYGLSNSAFLKWLGTYLGGENKAMTMNRFVNDTDPSKIMGLLAVKRLERLLSLKQYFSDDVNQFITVITGKGSSLPENTDLISLNANLSKIADVDTQLGIVRQFCTKCSGGEVDYDCMIQALEIVGGYKTLLAVRTPVENVIPVQDFITSKRPVAIFSQLVKSRSRFYPRPIRSACIAKHLSVGN